MNELEMRRRASPPSTSQDGSGSGAVSGTTGDRVETGVPAVASRRTRIGLTTAWAACAFGLLYAAVSVYWGLGGTALVDTVGGSLAKHAHSAGVMAAVWGAAVLKLIAALLPPLAVRDRRSSPRRGMSVLAWIAAGLLIVYGLVLTATGLLVQTGVIKASANADHRALAWHAYLWDPWFLVWGLLIAAALILSRPTAISAGGT